MIIRESGLLFGSPCTTSHVVNLCIFNDHRTPCYETVVFMHVNRLVSVCPIMVARILMLFLIIKWPYFVYLLVDPRFYTLLIFFMKHRAPSFPHRMDAPGDNTDKRTIGQIEKPMCSFVHLSVSWSLTLKRRWKDRMAAKPIEKNSGHHILFARSSSTCVQLYWTAESDVTQMVRWPSSAVQSFW